MCTVTYIPQGPTDFILTSNRDETPARSPRKITQIKQGTETLIFPRDTGAGGSWIAVSDNNRVACLLNGAFSKHHHRPPYKRSRGLMVLDYFTFDEPATFAKHYDFPGMEPFTMILIDRGQLAELRWDEKRVHFKPLNPQERYLWSSTSLYPPPVQAKRNQWFEEWQQNRQDFSPEAILAFHQHGGEKDEWNGFIMNRDNIVQTVSISSIVKTQTQIRFLYYDLVNDRRTSAELPLQSAP